MLAQTYITCLVDTNIFFILKKVYKELALYKPKVHIPLIKSSKYIC